MSRQKTGILIGVAVLVLASIGAGVITLLSKADIGHENISDLKLSRYAAVKACDLFTLKEAKSLMGDATTLGEATDTIRSESINVDTCSYTNNAAERSDIRITTVMVRSALDADGMTNNLEAFEPGGAANPTGAQAVSGYGEKAFWDPTLHTFTILKDNLWISIVYRDLDYEAHNLEDARKVADLVID